MMKVSAKFLILLLCPLILFLAGSPLIKVSASSADITISSDLAVYGKGDTVTVSLLIEAEVFPGDFEGYILYPADVLKYVSGPEIITGGEGVLKINDHVSSSERNTRKYVFKFSAIGLGNAEIALREDPELYEFEEGYLMSVSSNVLSISVIPAKDASSDTSLAVLKVSPGTLSPSFSSEVKEYEVTVPEGTDKLVVSAAAKDMDATVDVMGNDKLKPGKNKIEIRVTAPDGSTGTYTIICECMETEATLTPDDALVTEAPKVTDAPAGNTGFSALVSDGEIHLFTGNEFVVTEPGESIIIPEGYEKTTLRINGISIPVYAAKDDSDSMLLMILKDSNGNPALYDYDRTEKTIQRHTDKDTKTSVNVMTQSIEGLELAQSYEKSLNTLTIIIAVLSGLTLALLIIVISLSVKNRNDDLD